MIRKREKKSNNGFIIGAIVLVLFIALIMNGINQAKTSIASNAKDRLQEAIKNTAIQAYSIEGEYPHSIAEMEEKYGLRYDKERFFIDYNIIASNILPDIFIVDNQENGGDVDNASQR